MKLTNLHHKAKMQLVSARISCKFQSQMESESRVFLYGGKLLGEIVDCRSKLRRKAKIEGLLNQHAAPYGI